MTSFKHQAIGAAFQAFRATRLHRVVSPRTRGRGAILTFHHVRPWRQQAFAPNRLLEITPDFLDTVLTQTTAAGYGIVPVSEVLPRLRGAEGPPFVALTFDDGYRDLVTHALPVLERHRAPFTVYATTGFLDRSATLWWVDLAEAILRLRRLEMRLPNGRQTFVAGTFRQKRATFAAVSRLLQTISEPDRRAVVAALAREAGVVPRDLVAELCLDWNELKSLSAHPLATVGCHTRTHSRLAGLAVDDARAEMTASRDELADRLGRPVNQLCYPYGGKMAAAEREFTLAHDLGFESAVTTRPGVLFPSDADRPTALPRLSVNGLWQSGGAFDVLLSGAATAAWSLVRRRRAKPGLPAIPRSQVG